jgi:diaminobutyrate-2-oxoglutarate transaminase
LIRERLTALAVEHKAEVRGRGLIRGIKFTDPTLAGRASRRAFETGLLFETSGPRGDVVKIMPSLLLDDEELERGLDIVAASVDEAARSRSAQPLESSAK